MPVSLLFSVSPSPPLTSETPALYNCPLTAAGTVTSERTVRFHTLCSILSSTSGQTADCFLLLLLSPVHFCAADHLFNNGVLSAVQEDYPSCRALRGHRQFRIRSGFQNQGKISLYCNIITFHAFFLCLKHIQLIG